MLRVRCPTCLGDKFLCTDSFGHKQPTTAFDMLGRVSRGEQVDRCWTCQGEGAVTQRTSDYVVMEKMRVDLLLHKVLSA